MIIVRFIAPSHKFAIRNSQSEIVLQSYVFKLERLTFNSRRWWRDPVGNLADISHRMHQAPHILSILYSRQPFRLSLGKLFLANQVAPNVEVVAGKFPDVPMKSRVWEI